MDVENNKNGVATLLRSKQNLSVLTLVATIAMALVASVSLFLYSDPVSAHDKPATLWNPQSVDETLLPGQTKVIPITLTANKNLPESVVRVSPGLAPYVTVSPTTIGKTRKGEAVALTLTVNVPIDSPPAKLAGAIAFQKAKHSSDRGDDYERGGKTLAHAIPVSVEVVWPTTSVGTVNVSYPPKFSASKDDASDTIVLLPVANASDETDVEGPPRIAITIDKNSARIPIEQYYNEGPGIWIGDLVETTVVDGRTAYVYVPDESLAGDVIVIVPLSSGDFLQVTDLGAAFQQDGSFSQILSGIQIGE